MCTIANALPDDGIRLLLLLIGRPPPTSPLFPYTTLFRSIVIATLELARAIVLEATLSFLGLGIQPPTPSWGGMIYEGREYLDSAWWISTWPGLVLIATSLVVSRTGEWLRDLLDPTLRGEGARRA